MWRTIGQEWAIELLNHGLQRDRISNAYLFAGPHNIGKTMLGIELAQALNCREDDRPCGQCLSCQKIERSIHPDVRIVEPEKATLRIDQVRQVQRESILAPYEGTWRVYLFPGFERATAEAANCLLKTLEEPPPQVVLILTCGDVGALLPTIVSRCQVLPMRALPIQRVAQELMQHRDLDQERANLMARLSEGRIGWAFQACDDASLADTRRKQLDTLQEIQRQSVAERMQAANKLSRSADHDSLLDLWESWWRDVLLVRSDCPELLTHIDQVEALRVAADQFALSSIHAFLRSLSRTRQELRGNANVRLALEVLMMDCPRPSQ
jgi:DNA polymerase III subunit delta'